MKNINWFISMNNNLYRSYWSIEPNSTLGFLVMDNITALDEAVYKCEITYTKVHEGCNIVQFINLTTYSESWNR